MSTKHACSHRTRWHLVAAALGLLAAPLAQAVEASWSGFGTLGYAVSDQPGAYQRFVDDQGSFRRDSLLGAQLDLALTPTVSATVQGRLATALDDDRREAARLSWAFLSWRPDNDWLLRAGKLRVPMFMNSENTEVGTTFALAHQPAELYTTNLTPTTDLLGASFSRNLLVREQGELTLDGYWGRSRMTTRYYLRDDIPGFQPHGAVFMPLRATAAGLVLQWRSEQDEQLRLGLHRVRTDFSDAPLKPTSYPFVELQPGIGYYKTSALMAGPPLVQVDQVDYGIVTLGASLTPAPGWRLQGEWSRRRASGSPLAPSVSGGYLGLQTERGAWTPYLLHGWLRSSEAQLDDYARVNGNRVPAQVPQADLINAAQRAGADAIYAYDQRSWALGSSWRVARGQLLKAEWQRVRIGAVSQLVDAPAGAESGDQTIRIWSLSYNFVF
ncbi:MAG: hypothetical protein RJA44_1407 [Pseudomonadota bacterium]